jgi:hypothetical protein
LTIVGETIEASSTNKNPHNQPPLFLFSFFFLVQQKPRAKAMDGGGRKAPSAKTVAELRAFITEARFPLISRRKIQLGKEAWCDNGLGSVGPATYLGHPVVVKRFRLSPIEGYDMETTCHDIALELWTVMEWRDMPFIARLLGVCNPGDTVSDRSRTETGDEVWLVLGVNPNCVPLSASKAPPGKKHYDWALEVIRCVALAIEELREHTSSPIAFYHEHVLMTPHGEVSVIEPHRTSVCLVCRSTYVDCQEGFFGFEVRSCHRPLFTLDIHTRHRQTMITKCIRSDSWAPNCW